jgi:transposase
MPDGPATPEPKLPEDLAVCHGMLRELLSTHASDQKRISHLEHQLDQLLKRLYGPRADRLHPDQGSLFGDPPPEPERSPVLTPLESQPESKPKGHGRKSLPANLRRETVVVDIPEAEKLAVGGTWVRIGEEVSEKLDFTPSSLFVRRTVRPKYVVRFDAKPDELQVAELPPEALPKCKAAPGLIADIVVSRGPRSAAGWPRPPKCSRRSTLC